MARVFIGIIFSLVHKNDDKREVTGHGCHAGTKDRGIVKH